MHSSPIALEQELKQWLTVKGEDEDGEVGLRKTRGDGMGRDGMGRDGMGRDGMGWDGMGWDGMG